MLNSYCMGTKVPGYLRPKIFLKFLNIKFRCVFLYLLSQKLEIEPQHLWKLRSPKTSLRYACFFRGIQSLDYISHLISSKYQIIDHSLS